MRKLYPEGLVVNENINGLAAQMIAALFAGTEFDLGREVFPDGVHGPKVMATVKRFQKEKGIPQTGNVDEPTKNEMAKHFNFSLDDIPLWNATFGQGEDGKLVLYP